MLPVEGKALRAFPASKRFADVACPPLLRNDPRPVSPRWIVPDMPIVSALEFGDPVIFRVLMESNNAPVHLVACNSRSGLVPLNTDQTLFPLS